MTADLWRLVERWRDQAQHLRAEADRLKRSGLPGTAGVQLEQAVTLERCADELEAILLRARGGGV